MSRAPTFFDLEQTMRSLKRGKAPGLDSFPPDLFRAAPQQVSRLLCPLLAKVSAYGREPLAFKLGEV
eukprot:9484270-Pyramimonas_sp.AAC.1